MTGRVAIRCYAPRDAAALLEAARESIEEVYPWLEWCHPGYEISESRAWIEHCRRAWEAEEEYQFAIVGPDDVYLGGCGLNRVEHDHRVANLGYWVRSSATGRGVATSAARQVALFAFEATELNRLEILTAVDNHASQGVAERLGAIREGVARSRLHLHGKAHDAVQYAIVRGLWEPSAASASAPGSA